MQYKGLTLDKFQEEAIHAIEENHSVVVSAPTGSGKTLIADYIINRDIKKGIRVIYTSPIKALSNQKYKEFCKEYGEDQVGLLTGDMVKNPQGTVLIMTTEIYRNMVLVQDKTIANISYVIFDEIHFINDPDRGHIWEESIIFSPEHVRFVCLSATIPNAEEFASWIQDINHHKVVTIVHDHRAVPLEHLFYDAEVGIGTLEEIDYVAKIPEEFGKRRIKKWNRRVPAPNHVDLIKELGEERMPCIYFNFSRMECQKKGFELGRMNFFKSNPEITLFIRQKLLHAPSDINKLKTTQLLRQLLPLGIGFHHAGLLPIMKEIVEELFALGLIKVLYATDTFAVGINMPAKTVCFNSLEKYDGQGFRYLNTKEYFQCAGRAGRRGIDTKGFVVSMIDRRVYDYKKIKHLTAKDTEPIRSQFKLSYNTVLNLIQQHPQDQIDYMLRLSFYSYQKYGKNFLKQKEHIMHHSYRNKKKKLEQMRYVEGGHTSQLTEKGVFASKIFCDELIYGEIFGTPIYQELDTYQLLLLFAVLVYEKSVKHEFYKRHRAKEIEHLKHLLRQNQYLRTLRRFEHLEDITAIVKPVMDRKNFFDVLFNTNFPEGDMIRFLRQMLDRIDQIKKATYDYDLIPKLATCKGMIEAVLEGIDTI